MVKLYSNPLLWQSIVSNEIPDVNQNRIQQLGHALFGSVVALLSDNKIDIMCSCVADDHRQPVQLADTRCEADAVERTIKTCINKIKGYCNG